MFAQLWAVRRKRRDIEDATEAARRVVVVLAERAKEGDARNAQMGELTANMEAMTRTMVTYGRVSMGIAAVSLLVALAAVVLSA